jgi:hypothetical protein
MDPVELWAQPNATGTRDSNPNGGGPDGICLVFQANPMNVFADSFWWTTVIFARLAQQFFRAKQRVIAVIVVAYRLQGRHPVTNK